MPLNLLQCAPVCTSCVGRYAKKHTQHFKNSGSFDVACKGIPKDLPPEKMPALFLPEWQSDIVAWAAYFLDWHCLDPDGSILKRKNPERWAECQEKGLPSIYHRPYQAELLRCSAQNKVLRLGRQTGKTEQLCIMILHSLCTNEGFRALAVTPYEYQVQEIFRRLDALLRNSPFAGEYKYTKTAPLTITMANGSFVRGFSAGTSSNKDGANLRGQTAQLLVMDEADYMNRGDITTAMATTTSFGSSARMVLSSTPTGKRQKFYETCQSTMWREYHIPSHVNPTWDKTVEKMFKQELGPIAYEHEIMADFGEQEAGVFPVRYVDQASAIYDHHSRQPGWQYAMGVDWNSAKHGVTISVVGMNPHNHIMHQVEREVVIRAEMTQLSAVEKIIEIHRKWMPFSIRVDAGYGQAQIEMLRAYAQRCRLEGNYAEGSLGDKLKPFDFGGSIEVEDPMTHEKVKKPAKGFLVNMAALRFEQGTIRIRHDDEQIRKELLAYVVSRISDDGKLVFKSNSAQIGDHNLDALMLAMIAFTLEKDRLFHAPMSNEIGVVASNVPKPPSGGIGSPSDPIIANIYRQPKNDSQAWERGEKNQSHGNSPSVGTPVYGMWSRNIIPRNNI